MYELPRHRFLEMKHFCLQYWDWKKTYYILDGEQPGKPHNDITAYTAVNKVDLQNAIELIEKTAWDTDQKLGSYILKAVTENLTTSEVNPPVDSSIFLQYKRKFYYLLSQKRGI
jgi:hypothetical protein